MNGPNAAPTKRVRYRRQWRGPPKLTDHPNGPEGREDSMKNLMQTFWSDESGQDMAEYALLLVLIAVVVTVAVIAFRGAITDAFNNAETRLRDPS